MRVALGSHTKPQNRSFMHLGCTAMAAACTKTKPWLWIATGAVKHWRSQGAVDRKLIPEEPTSALVTQLFNDGNAAMVINGPWFWGRSTRTSTWGLAPLPIVSDTGKAAAPYLTVEAIQVSAHSLKSHKHGLARWLVATDQSIYRAVEGRQSVATTSAYADPRIGSDPILIGVPCTTGKHRAHADGCVDGSIMGTACKGHPTGHAGAPTHRKRHRMQHSKNSRWSPHPPPQGVNPCPMPSSQP